MFFLKKFRFKVRKSTSNTLTINHLPDEVLLEIFDAYLQRFISCNHWRKEHTWLNLAHVCRRWRAVVFTSSSRLDVSIVVGPKKPGHIKKILSSPLPIFIEYDHYSGEITRSALRRMRAALKRRDRVRGISIGGQIVDLVKFFKETNYHLPALESIEHDFPSSHKLRISATFLRRSDESDPQLRRLGLYKTTPASVSGLLLSTTALTALTLDCRNATAFDQSQGSALLASLQGMRCLRRLHLITPDDVSSSKPQDSVHKDIVPLLKLVYLRHSGSTIFLNNFMSGVLAPSLRDVRFKLNTYIVFPFLHLSRAIDDVRETFRSVSVTFESKHFLLSAWTQGEINRYKPFFRLDMSCPPNSINNIPSAKFAVVEELALFFPLMNFSGNEWLWEFPLREFLCRFRSVRLLRIRLDSFTRELEQYLEQDDGEVIFPVLEEIEVSISAGQHCVSNELAAFEPLVSACERAGRLVKVNHSSRGLTLHGFTRCW